MDRFIECRNNTHMTKITNLKSNMDRFIENCSYPNKVKKFNLKSNMDRFIAFNIEQQ